MIRWLAALRRERAELVARRYSLNFDHAYAHLRAGSPSIALRHFARCLRLRPGARLLGYLALAAARLARETASGRTHRISLPR